MVTEPFWVIIIEVSSRKGQILIVWTQTAAAHFGLFAEKTPKGKTENTSNTENNTNVPHFVLLLQKLQKIYQLQKLQRISQQFVNRDIAFDLFDRKPCPLDSWHPNFVDLDRKPCPLDSWYPDGKRWSIFC